jgi:hypothetical protein
MTFAKIMPELVIIVAGVSRAIGRAVAERLQLRGAAVVGAARNVADVPATASLLPVAADVTQETGRKEHREVPQTTLPDRDWRSPTQQPKGERTMASLQARLAEFKKAFESGAPPYNAPHEAVETMHRATAELKASGLENTALKVGDRAPEFSLFNQDHVPVNSVDLLRQGPLVVSFFRGHW